jgi:phage shock protein PspC (stress-responsive transcriptional regulator)
VRLAKRRDAGWFTGVAAGTGAYFSVDPFWVRLAFVISTMFGGLGVLLYVIATVFLPDATQSEVDARPITPRPYNQSWTTKEWYFGRGRVFLVIGMIATALSVSSAWDVGGFSFLVAVLLAGAGIYFLSDADRVSDIGDRLSGGVAPRTATTSSTLGYEMPSDFRPSVDPEIARQREQHLAARRVVRRDRRVLESVTLGVVLVVVGALAVLDRTNTHDFAVSTMLASALLTLGLGVLVGAWRGRSYLLILLAFLLTPFVIASNVVDGSVDDGVGERVWRPIDSSHVEAEYRLGTGRAELDLRDVQLADGEVRNVKVHVTTGLIDVKLPAGAGYDVTANIDYGHLDVLTDEDESVGPNRSTQRSAAGKGTFVVDAEMGNGAIVVDQTGANR